MIHAPSVLVVRDREISDDTTADLLAGAANLNGTPYRLQTVSRLSEAPIYIDRDKPACVIIDCGTPDSSSLDFLTRLRERDRDTAVIIVADFDDSRLSVELLKQGADDFYLRERLTAGSLARAIRSALHTRTLERELRRQRERLELFFRLVDQSSDALFVVDLGDNRLIEVNNALAQLFGYRQSELLGADYREHPLFFGARNGLNSLTDNSTGEPEVRFECDLQRGNKGQIPVELNAKQLRVGGRNYLVGMIRDISERRALETHLWRLSLTDGLTGAYNRRAFDDRLREEWGRAMRSRAPLALLLLDVDHFKAYNDTLGHVAGDHCLRRLVQTLQHVFRRAGDHVFRYGGEEFAVLIAQTDADAALRAAQMAREAFAQLRLPHPTSPIADHATVSVGCAVRVPQANQPQTELICRADQALYQAKNGGRNRVELAPDTADG